MKQTALAIVVALATSTLAQAQFGSALPRGLGVWTRASPGPDQLTPYSYDDGVSWNAMGLQAGGQTAWLMAFDAVGGSDVITSISVAYGTALSPGKAPPAGSAAHVAVWDDLDDDGDPATAMALVSTTPSTVLSPGQDAFEKTLVPASPVSGVFFVGVYMNHAAQKYPASLDDSTASSGRAWISGATTANGFNPGNLNSAGHVGLYELDALGFPSVWLLRAEGIGLPSTYCTAKSPLSCSTPSISASGIPSAGASSGFVVTAAPARSCKSGILLYNTIAIPGILFQGGTLCVSTMGLRRAGPTSSKGTPGNNCDGAFAIDMNAFAAAAWFVPDCAGNPVQLGLNAAPYLSVPGTDVYAQFWGRDTLATGSFVSNGLTWTIGP
jgi:hypothetical protein